MMTERQLRYRSGGFLIALHLIILLSLVIVRLLGGFDGKQFTTLLGLVMPMFSGYTSAIIAFSVKDRHITQDETPMVTAFYSSLLFVFPGVLSGIVLVAIWLQAFGRAFDNFEDFKLFVMTFESVFAVYVGIVVYSLFEKKRH
jgi:hypothetical protein